MTTPLQPTYPNDGAKFAAAFKTRRDLEARFGDRAEVFYAQRRAKGLSVPDAVDKLAAEAVSIETQAAVLVAAVVAMINRHHSGGLLPSTRRLGLRERLYELGGLL